MKKKNLSVLTLISLILIITLFSIIPFSSATSNSSNSESCVENWDCTSWDDCRYGERERDCVDINKCGTTKNKPSEIKYCYSNGHYNNYYYSDYMGMYCNPDNYYSKNHPCYDILRNNDMIYKTNYYDNYESELLNYYQNKYENPSANQNLQNNDANKIQIIQLSYPENNPPSDRYSSTQYKASQNYTILWIILASIFGALVFIILITILIITLRR